ncbi:ABC transporter substrate-binding protein [Candidatus Bathyarchaeota archaeon]|nr:ABC transporter substrate-binding protein [Candidatus Bathyarchaeota archaeon]
MNKTTAALAAIILVVAVLVASYGVYRLYVPSENESQGEPITIVDATGAQINVTLPVERIVSLNPGLTEIICALDCGDRIVGRDANSVFPSSVSEKTVVGQNSYDPNLEVLLEMEPDVIVADSMLSYNTEALEKLATAGLPVVIEEPSNVSRVKIVTSNFGLIFGKEEKAAEINDYISSYENLVNERVKDLASSEKPLVYIEWYQTWQTFTEDSIANEIIVNAGGVNIAGEITTTAPVLSPEYVVEKNPDIIVRMISGDLIGNMTGFEATHSELMNRAGLGEVTAVKEGKVYVYDPIVVEGIRYPVGLLYWAKWFHPSLFEDIDPAAVHAELIQQFFGVTLEGVHTYP